MNVFSNTLILVYVVLVGLAAILYLISRYFENKENNAMAKNRNTENVTVNPINLTINDDMLAIFPLLSDLNIVMVSYYIRKTDSKLAGYNGGLVASRIVYHLFKAQETYADMDIDSAIITLSAMYEQNPADMQKDGKHEHLATQAGIVAWCKENGYIKTQPMPIATMPHKAGIELQKVISNIRKQVTPMPASTTPPMPTQAISLLDNGKDELSDYPAKFEMFGNNYELSDNGMLADKTVKYVGGIKFVEKQVSVGDTLTIGDSLYTVTKILYKGKNLNLRYAGKVQAANPVQTQAAKRSKPVTKSPIVQGTLKTSAQLASMPIETPNTNSARIDALEQGMNTTNALLQALIDKLGN